MSTTAEIAKRYFDALSEHDLDGALSVWEPGGVDRLVGQRDLVAPGGIREYFGELFAAFPDFTFEVLEMTTAHKRTAVRWRARGTFAGPGTFQGFAPNGARIDFEGCDVLTVSDEKIQHNEAFADGATVARQLGVMPPAGSPTEQRLAKIANVRTKIASRIQGSDPEPVADGVWIVRGGFPMRTMNAYVIEDAGAATVFDSGIEAMTPAIARAAARLGGIRRIVLSHADADHRGGAPGLRAPVYCHPAEREVAEAEFPDRPYVDFAKMRMPARYVISRMLRVWDGGPVPIEGTLGEGDEVAGFRVIELPGHAPGLIGLFRESDRLALSSDCFYTLDVETGLKGPPRLPHPSFQFDIEQARASLRRLAAMEPSAAWPGHADAVTGDVRAQLEQAAER